MKNKLMVMTMVTALLASQAFGAAGDGVQIEKNSSIDNIGTPASAFAPAQGSMTFALEVQDSIEYRLLNDGADATDLDVIVDLGSISAGIESAADGAECSAALTGVQAESVLGVTLADNTTVVNADCKISKQGAVVKARFELPLRATLVKSGSTVFDVVYSRENGAAAFQAMRLESKASHATASDAGAGWNAGSDIMGASQQMDDQDDLPLAVEIEADLNGANAKSIYQEALLVSITLS